MGRHALPMVLTALAFQKPHGHGAMGHGRFPVFCLCPMGHYAFPLSWQFLLLKSPMGIMELPMRVSNVLAVSHGPLCIAHGPDSSSILKAPWGLCNCPWGLSNVLSVSHGPLCI